MKDSAVEGATKIVREVCARWIRNASPCLLFLLAACRTAPPDEAICGPGTPPGCVEMIDGTCYVDEYPPPYYPEGVRITDEHIDGGTLSDHSCGMNIYVRCPDERYIGYMGVSEEGHYVSGVPGLYDGALIEGGVVDSQSRLALARGILTRDAACERIWYGDRDAYPCFEPMIALVYERYGSCTDTADPCDYCACRVNEVTDVQYPGCEVDG